MHRLPTDSPFCYAASIDAAQAFHQVHLTPAGSAHISTAYQPGVPALRCEKPKANHGR